MPKRRRTITAREPATVAAGDVFDQHIAALENAMQTAIITDPLTHREAGPWWLPGQFDPQHPKPWLHPMAIAKLDELLTKDMRVIEHGSGGSTLWMAQRVREVTAYELKIDWASKITAYAPPNVKMINGAFPLTAEVFDLMLIDGEPVTDRAEWILRSPMLVKIGGIIVLDNANRPEYAAERERMQEWAELFATFKSGALGHRHLVTEFYRRRGL